MSSTALDPTSVWSGVVGQPRAVERLRRTAESPVHAYLFVGPAGSTKKEAARAFATRLMTGSDDRTGRDAELIMRGDHPDVTEVERVGAHILKDQAVEVIHASSLAPVEGDHKVMILNEFHLLDPEAAARLLKTIEEPPASTTFLILADSIPHDLVTIASRCTRIDFGVIPDGVIAEQLIAEGADTDTAHEAAKAAGGNLGRARLLAADPALVERRRAFAAVPHRIDGHGNTVVELVDDLLARIEEAAAPLVERHAREVAELQERIERYGLRGSGKDEMEKRHKREMRRHRTDELKAGLTVIAGVYRDAIVAGAGHRTEEFADAVRALHAGIDAFELNPNEQLLLQSLVWSLPPL
jgi:DNA polymerase-3 subunit delta'